MVKIQVVETLHSTNAFKGTEGSSQWLSLTKYSLENRDRMQIQLTVWQWTRALGQCTWWLWLFLGRIAQPNTSSTNQPTTTPPPAKPYVPYLISSSSGVSLPDMVSEPANSAAYTVEGASVDGSDLYKLKSINTDTKYPLPNLINQSYATSQTGNERKWSNPCPYL